MQILFPVCIVIKILFLSYLLFRYSPIKNLTQEIMPTLPLIQSSRKTVRSTSTSNINDSANKIKNAKTQTIYRESSAQTSPWQPDYKVMDRGDPEILKLDFLKWGKFFKWNT